MSGATPETIYTGTVLPVIFNPGKVSTDQSHRGSLRQTAFGMSQQPFVFGSQMTVFTRPGTVFFQIEVPFLSEVQLYTGIRLFLYGRVHNVRLSHTALPLSRQEPGML